MATPGVKLDIPKDRIVCVLRKHKGRLVSAAGDLNITRDTLRKWIDKDPELVVLLAELRLDLDENLKDKAENYLELAMNQSEDLSNGLKSAFFVLNNKGKDRGYNPPVINQQGDIKITPEQLRSIKEAMLEKAKPAD